MSSATAATTQLFNASTPAAVRATLRHLLRQVKATTGGSLPRSQRPFHLPSHRQWFPVVIDMYRSHSQLTDSTSISKQHKKAQLYVQYLQSQQDHLQALREAGWGLDHDTPDKIRATARFVGLSTPQSYSELHAPKTIEKLHR